MMTLPSFAALVRAYPNHADPSGVFALIGGKVQANNYPNSCVIRVSRALNYSGQPIRRGAGVLTSSGADGKWYAPRVAESDGYMRRNYGKPGIEVNDLARTEGSCRISWKTRHHRVQGDWMDRRHRPLRPVGRYPLHPSGLFRQGQPREHVAGTAVMRAPLRSSA